MRHRIYIVEDHAVVRKGYAYLIGRETDLEVCGEAATAQEALEEIGDLQPDLVVVDLMLEGMNGIELIKHMQAQWPDLPVLVISAYEEVMYAERALRAGARGYAMKSMAASTLLDAIRSVLRGRRYVTGRMAEEFLRRHLEGGSVTTTVQRPPVQQLTDRELEMFELLGRGFKRQEIAESMLISPKTVDTYRERMKAKLHVDTSAQLAQRAVAWLQKKESI